MRLLDHLLTNMLSFLLVLFPLVLFSQTMEEIDMPSDTTLAVISQEADQANFLSHKATVFGEQGHPDSCLFYLNQALEINKSCFSLISEEVASTYHQLGIWAENFGDYTKAIFYFQQALDISEMIWGRDDPICIHYLSKMADCYFAWGQLKNSLKSCNKAIALSEKYADELHEDRAAIFYRKGLLYLELDSLDKAYKQLLEARRQFRLLQQKERLYAIHLSLGDYHEIRQGTDSALYHYNLAIRQLIPSFRWDDLTDNPQKGEADWPELIWKGLFKKGKTLSHAATLSQDEDLLEYGLECFTLSWQQFEQESFSKSKYPSTYLARDSREICAQIISANAQLHEITEDAAYKEATFEAMVAFRNYALKGQTYRNPGKNDFSSARELPEISFSQSLIDLAAQEACLLSYFRTDSLMYAMILSSRGSHLKILPLPAYFDSLAMSFLKEVRKPNLSASEAAFKRFCTSAHELYSLIFAPIEGFIPLQNDLLIAPDGILGGMPFEAMIDKLPGNPEDVDYVKLPYLVKRFEIGYRYHTPYPEADHSINKLQYLAFAPASGEAEIKAISDNFEGQIRLQSQATEAAFKQLAGDYPMLHLALDCQASGGEQTYPYLPFHPDTLEDGKLHSFELYNLKLSANLVVLSDCNTAISRQQAGADITQLAHAFAYAGCPNIVMSLWQVDDPSQPQLMSYFYENMAAKQRKSEALRGAKRRLLTSAEYLKAHPFYWARMISIGDQSPLSETSYSLYWVIGFVVVGIGFSLWKFR